MEVEVIFVCSKTHVSCPQLSGAGPLHSIACVAQTHTWAPRCVPGRGAPWPHHVHEHTSLPQTVRPTCSGIPYKHRLLEQDPLLRRQSKPRYLGPAGSQSPGSSFHRSVHLCCPRRTVWKGKWGLRERSGSISALRDSDCPLALCPAATSLAFLLWLSLWDVYTNQHWHSMAAALHPFISSSLA